MRRLGILTFIFVAIFLGVSYFFLKKRIFPEKHKILNLALSLPLDSLDPQKSHEQETEKVLYCMYQRLFKIDPFNNNKLVPEIAEEIPEVKNKILTIKIKKNIKFHDNECFEKSENRELTVKDIVYTILRNVDPQNINSKYSELLKLSIRGIEEWCINQTKNKVTNFYSDIKGLEIVDDYTLKIHFLKMIPNFLKIFISKEFLIVSQKASKFYKNTLADHPIGTGPYKLGKKTDKFLILSKNKDYNTKFLSKDTDKNFSRRLNFDFIKFYIIKDPKVRFEKFKNRELDILEIRDNMINDIFKIDHTLNKNFEQFKFIIKDDANTVCIGVNLNNNFLKNITVRQAISLSLDRKEFNNLFFNGLGEVAQSLLPPNTEGYENEYMNSFSIFDPERSNQLLEDAGYHNKKQLPLITIDIENEEYVYSQAKYISKSLQNLGFNTKIITNSHYELLKKIQAGKLMLYLFSFNANMLSFIEFFPFLNISCIKKDSILNIFENLNLNSDYTINRKFGEFLPFIFLIHKKHISLYQPTIKYIWKPFFKDYIIYTNKILSKIKNG